MKVKLENNGEKRKVTFIPESVEEKRIMGTLRDHFFWGRDDESEKTFPQYAGITSEDNYVTSLGLEFNVFK